MSMQSAIKTGRPRNQAKSTHSRSYPRGVGIDFRKLAGLTLMSYIDHHGKCAINQKSTDNKNTPFQFWLSGGRVGGCIWRTLFILETQHI